MSKDNPPPDPMTEMFNSMWDRRPYVCIGTCARKGRLSIHFGDTSLGNAEKVLSICEEHGLTVDEIHDSNLSGSFPKMSFPVKSFDALVAALRGVNANIEIGGAALVLARYSSKARGSGGAR